MGPHQYQPTNQPPVSAAKHRSQRVTGFALVKLLEVRPLLFWGGLWASLCLVGLVSLSSILSPGSPGRMASGAALGSSSNKTVHEVKQKSRVPIWLFGAIALTCTAGSIVVSKQLGRPQTSASRRQTPAKVPVKLSTTAHSPHRRKAPQRLKPYAPTETPLPPATRRPVPAPKPVSTAAIVPTSRMQQPYPAPQKPQPQPQQVAATIVPADENHPLDWGTASLADAVDLRKRRSLSSWM